MAVDTDIQFSDDTVNPAMGCDGCELWKLDVRTCYAGRLHQMYPNHAGFAKNFDVIEKFPGRTAKASRASPLTDTTRTKKPWLNGLPRLIFVSDMGDVLSAAIDFPYLKTEIVDVVVSDRGRKHRWLWLTKRPGRMAEFSDWLAERGIAWPQQLWAGTSLTTQSSITRVDQLARVGDATTNRFLSVEPQWEKITLGERLAFVDWVIQGGESGPEARPFDIDWGIAMRQECAEAGVAYFLKQLGKCPVSQGFQVKLKDGHGGEWGEWPESYRVRQMPDFRIVAGPEPAATRQAPPIVVEAVPMLTPATDNRVTRETDPPEATP